MPTLQSLPACAVRVSSVEKLRPPRSTATAISWAASNARRAAEDHRGGGHALPRHRLRRRDDRLAEQVARFDHDARVRVPELREEGADRRVRVRRRGEAALPGRRDVEETHQIRRVAPGREAMGDLAARVRRMALDELDLQAVAVERDVAGQAGDLVERLPVGPHRVLERRIRHRHRPVVGLALERADRVVVGRREVLPRDARLGEVELRRVVGLEDDQARVALREHALAEADAAAAPPRHEVDPVARVAGPRGRAGGHGIRRSRAGSRSGPGKRLQPDDEARVDLRRLAGVLEALDARAPSPRAARGCSRARGARRGRSARRCRSRGGGSGGA